MTPVPFCHVALPRVSAFGVAIGNPFIVMPAKAGIQKPSTGLAVLDSRFCGNDTGESFERRVKCACSARLKALPGMAAVIALSVAVAFPASRPATADDQGARLAATCTSCHRLDGQDDGIPSVVGQDAESLTRKMQAFKSGERPSMIMHAVALTLSDEEVAILARYLAEQGKGATP